MKKELVSLCLPFLVCVFIVNSYAYTGTIEFKGGTYTGEVSDGVPNGKGSLVLSDGETYVGQWKDGDFHGQGSLVTTYRGKYFGEWKDGKKHGQGTFTYVGGDIYVGEFKDDDRNGWGVYKSYGGTYVGEWTDDHYRQGTLTIVESQYSAFPQYDSFQYIGEFKNNLMHGKGIFISGEHFYIGNWENSKPSNGTVYDKDGNVTHKTFYRVFGNTKH